MPSTLPTACSRPISLAVVLYDDQVQVPVALRPGGDPAAIRLALSGVESGGCTALFDGWEAGAKILEGGAAGSLSRVLLLSDGQANRGLCSQAEIEKHCADWAARGVSTTTVGLGRNFNEDLMIGMARAGCGQQYYGQRAEDLHDGFDEELALLQSLYLRKVRVKLVPGAWSRCGTAGPRRPADSRLVRFAGHRMGRRGMDDGAPAHCSQFGGRSATAAGPLGCHR